MFTDYLEYADGKLRDFKSLGNFFVSKMIKIDENNIFLLEFDII
jgi:hypothetical protein